jgi:DNA-binding IclR family transcriptional regulator
MLWELSVVEQRYRAVLEVMAGVPVTEVAERYGVSRQTVHRWLGRYQRDGPAGLADRRIGPGIIRGGCRRIWRPGSASCAARIAAGGRAGWCSRWTGAATGG